MARVSCYIDGFNLYHAIDELNRPHLKWIDLRSLAQSLCRDGETLVEVSYFSAYATWRPDRYARHRQYVAALRATGVTCHMARFSVKTAHCRRCGNTWQAHEEKETDVHFAVTFLEDALDDVFDRAIIVSADSDYLPSMRRVRARLPSKEVFIATPPNTFGKARGLLSGAHSGMTITAGRLGRCLLPENVTDTSGEVVARRPRSYRPPARR